MSFVFLLIFIPSLLSGAGWTLYWSDEFNATAGSGANAAKWTAETGGDGWGNSELQFHTDERRNVSHDGKGNLVITAMKEAAGGTRQCWYGTCGYTSARLFTKDKFSQRYGKIEARMKLPTGQGMWPAFWMLGTSYDRVGWPACGEIDIMENVGHEPSTAHGTLHGPGYDGENGITGSYRLPDGKSFSDGFHVFAIEWEPQEIRWYVDGQLYQRKTPADLPRGAAWVFDQPFFLILNLAVGGDWPGAPDGTTVFPQRLEVDYVRAYTRSSGSMRL